MRTTSLLAAVWLTACGGDPAQAPAPEPEPEQTEKTLVDEAAEQMPTYLDLHAQVVYRTCSPTSGVCHNTKEFPDLHTPGNMLDAIGKPCNLGEEPGDIYDGCEPAGDIIRLTTGPRSGDEMTIAWHDVDGDDWVVTLEDPVAGDCEPHRASLRILSGEDKSTIITADGAPMVVQCGSNTVTIQNIASLGPLVSEALLRRVAGGDPNRNGVFGYDGDYGQLVPGNPERSYLLAQMLGTVPGSRMPLANQPLSDPEWIAIYCWIETLDADPREEDPIRYDECEFAAQVLAAGKVSLPEALRE